MTKICPRCEKDLNNLVVRLNSEEICYDCYQEANKANTQQEKLKIEPKNEFYAKMFNSRAKKLIPLHESLFPEKIAYVIENNKPIKNLLDYDDLVKMIVENVIELAQEQVENLCEVEEVKDFNPFKNIRIFPNNDMRTKTLALVELRISEKHMEKLDTIGFSKEEMREFFLECGNIKIAVL